jgi:hypothetical protein
MSDIEWIMFSKNRTLQAKSCIVSLAALSETMPQEITVIYVDSKTIDYEPLKRQFTCRFIRQTDFYQDVMDVLRHTSKPLIGFIVDDLIFRERFSCQQIANLIERHKDLDCFSLRLGRNIKDGKAPMFKGLEPGVISWDTAKGLGKSWNYFWEVSGSIYRKVIVLDYLERCSSKEITFPNSLEFHYYKIIPNFSIGRGGILEILTHPRYLLWALFYPLRRIKRMACYEKSRAFTQGINMVAGRGISYDTYIATEKLHELFLGGYRIDFECLKDVQNDRPNAGRKYFRLRGPNGEIHPLSLF